MRSSRRVARLQQRVERATQERAAVAHRAAGYLRVSSEEQATHGFGLETQERAIRAYAESQGYDLVAIASDPGVSGATKPAERPGFRELLEIETISILLVWKFDRLARQIIYSVTTANELAERGIAVRSVTEPIDTATPMGRTIFAVLSGMAEQERQAITERTWHGRREKAAIGGYAGGAAPYGYSHDSSGLVVVHNEADIVRRIYAMRDAGLAHAEIARRLNSDGLRTRRGKPWRHGGIAYILDNPKYRGAIEYLFRWCGGDSHLLRDGAHQAIVTAPAD